MGIIRFDEVCKVCQAPMWRLQPTVICPKCGRRYHQDCYGRRGCSNSACQRAGFEMSSFEKAEEEDSDFSVKLLDPRIPCPDDICTGAITVEGVCGYCGRRWEGKLSAGTPGESVFGASGHSARADQGSAGMDGAGGADGAAGGMVRMDAGIDGAERFGGVGHPIGEETYGIQEPDDPDGPKLLSPRVPCPDDMCVGAITVDGVCGYCGTSAPPDVLAKIKMMKRS